MSSIKRTFEVSVIQLEFLLVLQKILVHEPSKRTGREILAIKTLHISEKFSKMLFKNRHPFGLVSIVIFFLEMPLRWLTLHLEINVRVFCFGFFKFSLVCWLSLSSLPKILDLTVYILIIPRHLNGTFSNHGLNFLLFSLFGNAHSFCQLNQHSFFHQELNHSIHTQHFCCKNLQKSFIQRWKSLNFLNI